MKLTVSFTLRRAMIAAARSLSAYIGSPSAGHRQPLQHLPCRLGRPSRAWPAQILFGSNSLTRCNQRLRAHPKIVRHLPGVRSFSCRHTFVPSLHVVRLGTLVYLFTDKFLIPDADADPDPDPVGDDVVYFHLLSFGHYQLLFAIASKPRSHLRRNLRARQLRSHSRLNR